MTTGAISIPQIHTHAPELDANQFHISLKGILLISCLFFFSRLFNLIQVITTQRAVSLDHSSARNMPPHHHHHHSRFPGVNYKDINMGH